MINRIQGQNLRRIYLTFAAMVLLAPAVGVHLPPVHYRRTA